ncbi:MAG: hypothetical protein RR797_05985, partial [Christensenella sp.]
SHAATDTDIAFKAPQPEKACVYRLFKKTYKAPLNLAVTAFSRVPCMLRFFNIYFGMEKCD